MVKKPVRVTATKEQLLGIWVLLETPPYTSTMVTRSNPTDNKEFYPVWEQDDDEDDPWYIPVEWVEEVK